jgi:hypothetical protein
VPCDEDDWEFSVRRGELALKIKTPLPRQPDVEDQAGGANRRIKLEKVGNGRKQVSIQAERSQQTPQAAKCDELTRAARPARFFAANLVESRL